VFKGTPGDAKCVTEILGGGQNREVRDKMYVFVSREHNSIKLQKFFGADTPVKKREGQEGREAERRQPGTAITFHHFFTVSL